MVLSSKWPVCRSIVNYTTGGTSRTQLSTMLKTNIFKYLWFAIKRLKYTCNKGILSIQIMGKCSFVLFWNFFPFNYRECVDLVAVFNKKMKEAFAVSLQNRKSCVCIKYLTLFRPRKLVSLSFAFLHSM